MKVLPILCLGVFCNMAWSAEPDRLSIPEVLNPETRLAAFYRYCFSAGKIEKTSAMLSSFEWFAQGHQDLRVTVSPYASGGPRYLLSWSSNLAGREDWTQQVGVPENRQRPAEVLVPHDRAYRIFGPAGEPLSEEGSTLSESVVIDADGDGAPEEIDALSRRDYDDVPASLEWEFLVVRPVQLRFEKISFAVLYNVRPKDRRLRSTWGFQVRPGRGGEGGTLELGPLAGTEGVEPAVVFHWDLAMREWTGPQRKPGDHFVVIKPEDPARGLDSDTVFHEAERLAHDGTLSLPLMDAPAPPPSQPRTASRKERVDKDEVSKPYERRSLAGLSNEETLAYMGGRRSISEYVWARKPQPPAVENFWTQDPAESALAYVRANRPPQLETRYLYHFATAEGEKPPDVGDFTLTDGPSGCFAAGGAYVHHLHCAPEGSFLTFVRALNPWFGISHIVSLDRAEVRKIDLTHDQARRLWQTLWWMSRLRTRPVSESNSSEFNGGSSTSDGEATIQLITGQEKTSITGTRTDPYVEDYAGTSMGVSQFSSAYSTTAFINLVVRLFKREVPAWLGGAWTSQAPPDRDYEQPQPPEELVGTRRRVAEVLQLALDGKVTPDVAEPAVGMVGDHGWQELRPTVEKLATQLPPPFAWEVRRREIEQELEVWKEKFGEAASARASWQRRLPPGPDPGMPPMPAIPGQVSSEPSPAAKVEKQTERERVRQKQQKEAEKFAALDALYEEHQEAGWRATHAEQQVAALRARIPCVLRQLELFNDPAALLWWVTKEDGSPYFALPRLTVLDRRRALQLLDWWEKQDPREEQREQFARDRAKLKDQPWVSDEPLPKEKRAAYLAQVRRTMASDKERCYALRALLPSSDPGRYREAGLNEALLDYLRTVARKGIYTDRNFGTAAAFRSGGKAWDAIVGRPAQAPERMAFFESNLPGLCLIAQREPRPYRDKLKRLIAPELQNTHGELDAVLFAVWRVDLREFRPVLERIATSGPADYEGPYTRGTCTPAEPVDEQRYHRARHILALWDEKDAFTRARLQIAFAVEAEESFAAKADGALDFLCRGLRSRSFTPEQRAALREWTDWCEHNAGRQLDRALLNLPKILPEIRAALAEKH